VELLALDAVEDRLSAWVYGNLGDYLNFAELVRSEKWRLYTAVVTKEPVRRERSKHSSVPNGSKTAGVNGTGHAVSCLASGR
jgi:hypothetical protein